MKIVLRNNKYFVETGDPTVLRMLREDAEIGPCRVRDGEEVAVSNAASVCEAEERDKSRLAPDQGGQATRAALEDEDNDDEQDTVYSFQIQDDKVSKVAQRCLVLHYPALEEYDFRNDNVNANPRNGSAASDCDPAIPGTMFRQDFW